jgi:hypothetical protein
VVYANVEVAIVLVDPPLSPNLKRAIYIEDEDDIWARAWQPCRKNNKPRAPLPRLSQLGNGNSLSPLGESMFEDLLVMQHGVPSKLPSSVTYGCRRLVLAYMTDTFQRAFSSAINLATASSVGLDLSKEMSSFDFKEFEKKAWNSDWSGRRFTKLWEQREDLELLQYKLRQNIQTIRRLTLHEPHDGSPANIIQRQEQDDLSEWLDLESMAEYVNKVVLRTTDSYLQTVSAGQAQVANFQALLYVFTPIHARKRASC